MKMTLMRPVDVEVSKFRFEVEPRYFSDCDIISNDIDTTDMDPDSEEKEAFIMANLPGVLNDLWIMTVDADSGKIIEACDEPVDMRGMTIKVHFKVCDAGYYQAIDEKGEIVYSHEGYVPSILQIDDDGWGDYIILTIKDGVIQNWDPSKLEEFFCDDDE